MDQTVEYGVFNIMPEGKTIEDIPEELRWLYLYPIQTGHDKKEMEQRVRDINDWRKTFFERRVSCYDIDSYCEIQERVITYGPWIQSNGEG